ncbi:MAG: DUF1573 domain-containing protein [Muribaculaceae bacterium]|nr:DUF1573 domain-containing protein [Muribaculaceae bacterium]
MNKKLIFILAAIFLVSICVKADETEKFASIEFNERSHDFGTIKDKDGPVSYEFEFKNTGNKPLVIVDVLASCGCTRPEFPTKPIKPGKKGKIKVTYSPYGRPPGPFSKTVKVKSNAKESRVILLIQGTTVVDKSKN